MWLQKLGHKKALQLSSWLLSFLDRLLWRKPAARSWAALCRDPDGKELRPPASSHWVKFSDLPLSVKPSIGLGSILIAASKIHGHKQNTPKRDCRFPISCLLPRILSSSRNHIVGSKPISTTAAICVDTIVHVFN